MNPQAMSVLVVEDNPAYARVLCDLLAADAASVRTSPAIRLDTAGCLEEAVRRLDEGGVDAVLLDLGLPQGAGINTVQAVLARAPDAVVVLTGQDDEELVLQCIRRS